MKNIILRKIFIKYSSFFTDMVVEEFTRNIPSKLEEGAIEVIAKRRRSVEKWIFSVAYQIQRKSVVDITRTQFYQGQLATLKVILLLIGKPEYESKDEDSKIGETTSMKDYQKMKESIDNFKKGKLS